MCQPASSGSSGCGKRRGNDPIESRATHRPGPTSASKVSCRTGRFTASTNGSCAMPPTQTTGRVHVDGSSRSNPVSAQSRSRHRSTMSRGTARSSLMNPSSTKRRTRAPSIRSPSWPATGALKPIPRREDLPVERDIFRSQVGAFGRVLGRPVLRRVLPAMALSAIGDGMSVVAVAWLAVRIAPPDRSGVWTGLAVAAYALPATVGAGALARLVRRLPGTALVTVDASLRAIALGSIAALAIAGVLTPAVYVVLLALSSLLHAW